MAHAGRRALRRVYAVFICIICTRQAAERQCLFEQLFVCRRTTVGSGDRLRAPPLPLAVRRICLTYKFARTTIFVLMVMVLGAVVGVFFCFCRVCSCSGVDCGRRMFASVCRIRWVANWTRTHAWYGVRSACRESGEPINTEYDGVLSCVGNVWWFFFVLCDVKYYYCDKLCAGKHELWNCFVRGWGFLFKVCNDMAIKI